MSDPTAKGEIEDVLSSIRKLVTDGDTPEKGRKMADDKFVLTSDFRVDEAPEQGRPVAPVDAGASPQAVPADDLVIPSDLASAPPDGADLEREVAELEAVLMGGDAAAKVGDGAYDAWEPAGDNKGAAFAKPGADVADAEVTAEEVGKESEVVVLATGKRNNAETSDSNENVGKPDIESLLDENDLRALVAEVLREELKGPLGERITRNVRKLVRREIVQALSSLDIE